MHPDLVSAVPKILMVFYQADILDEEVITQWGTHVSKKYVDKDTSKKVRKASEPFLKVRALRSCLSPATDRSDSQWLEEAEDDDDDE
jgi:translation initiation factor 5